MLLKHLDNGEKGGGGDNDSSVMTRDVHFFLA